MRVVPDQSPFTLSFRFEDSGGAVVNRVDAALFKVVPEQFGDRVDCVAMRQANDYFSIVGECFSSLIEELRIAICAVCKPRIWLRITHLEDLVLILIVLPWIYDIDIV